MTCKSCTTELDGILYSQESVELAVVQGGDNHSSLPDYLVNTIQLGAPWNSTVLNCGNPCTSQTIDLETIGLAAGDVYTVWLRETNAIRLLKRGLCRLLTGSLQTFPELMTFNRQAPGLSSESDVLTIIMDNTHPTVPLDLIPCTPLGLVSSTSAGRGSTQVSWLGSTQVSWCWTSPVRHAALGTDP